MDFAGFDGFDLRKSRTDLIWPTKNWEQIDQDGDVSSDGTEHEWELLGTSPPESVNGGETTTRNGGF
jgi:hypothetical protein